MSDVAPADDSASGSPRYRPTISLAETVTQLIKRGRFDRRRREVAEGLGVTTSALSQYEKGASRPSFQVLVKMAAFFDVSLDYLVFGETRPLGHHVDYGPLARYVDRSFAQLQTHTAARSSIVARIASNISADMPSTIDAYFSEYQRTIAGVMQDSETLTIERYALTTDLVTMNLKYDLAEATRGSAVPGRFLEVVARNLAQGRSIRILLPDISDTSWSRAVSELRHLLSAASDRDLVMEHCNIRVYSGPLMTGMCLYRLDLEALRTDETSTFAQFADNIHEGRLGYLIAPSDELYADVLMDRDHLDHALVEFERIWDSPKSHPV